MLKNKIRTFLNPYRNHNIEIAVNFVTGRNIEGDYYEFGVHAGQSFVFAYQKLTQARNGMLQYHVNNNLPGPQNLLNGIRFFAFDSFEGLPVASGVDNTSKLPSHWKKGQFKASEDMFLDNLKRAKISLGQVEIIKGWYNDTLTNETKQQRNMSKGCIFHVDCDLYESTKVVLEFIRDLYVDGSVLIFDDWFGFRGNPAYGEQKAFNEWKEKYKIYASELTRFGGQSVAFIIHAD